MTKIPEETAFSLNYFECKCGQIHNVHKYILNIDCSCGKYWAREEWEDFEGNELVKRAGYRQLNEAN